MRQGRVVERRREQRREVAGGSSARPGRCSPTTARHGDRQEDAPGARHRGRRRSPRRRAPRRRSRCTSSCAWSSEKKNASDDRVGDRRAVLEVDRARGRCSSCRRRPAAGSRTGSGPDCRACRRRRAATTTAATMAMCHHTLTWFRNATRLIPAMLRTSSMSIRMPIVTSWPSSTTARRRASCSVVDPGIRQERRDDRGVEERRRGVVDAGHDRELADQVEPGGPPAPVLVLHLAGPVVQAAGGRVGRGDLGHRRRDQQDEDRDERPADAARRRCRPRPGRSRRG